jgi:hypothetical protein
MTNKTLAVLLSKHVDGGTTIHVVEIKALVYGDELSSVNCCLAVVTADHELSMPMSPSNDIPCSMSSMLTGSPDVIEGERQVHVPVHGVPVGAPQKHTSLTTVHMHSDDREVSSLLRGVAWVSGAVPSSAITVVR